VKPNKPAPKAVTPPPPVAAKAPRAKPESVKPNPEKVAPIKFDTRPLVMTRVPQNDEDGDGETSASLLAGPRNVKPYIARRGEQYMNKEQLEHFARILQTWKRDLMVEVDRTVLHMKDEAANFPDPNDRATQEEEFSLELRTRDRERKLIRKIDEALKRIEDGSYGYCLETGEEIGIKRLEARPVATLSVEAQERRERREKQYGDRDDRYR
jgi:DnaK suppressor protein